MATGLVAVTATSDANASVSIAVGYDALVKDADAVAVATPTEQKSVWEDGRIYTYTKLKVDQGVAGDVGSESWVRTMGGVVGKIGQLVDGEAVFTVGKPSLLFLHRFKGTSNWEVSARAQGQYPVSVDDVAKVKKVSRSASVGVLLPPKGKAADIAIEAAVQAQSMDKAAAARGDTSKVRLAQEALHDRPLDEVTREIAASWKKLHPAAK